MMEAKIKLPEKLIPIFSGEADVRGAYGGRGSGKTRSFAKMTAVWAYAAAREGKEGIILCGRQFMNSLDDSSLEEIKAAIRSELWLDAYFDIGEKYIKTKDGRVRYVFSGLDRNISSVKSKSKILICWVDEAEEVTENAWVTLIPTIREDGSELWVTWNPKRDGSATDKRFRKTKDPLFKIAGINWKDNPKFPARLKRERLRDLENNPEMYDHIWEGDYIKQLSGAYYAKNITQAKKDNRISVVGSDPLMTIRLFADIGGTGAKADAFSFWVAQFIGKQVRVLNYYEKIGQPLATHLEWMRENEYYPAKAQIWLPHDGDSNDKVIDVSYASAFGQAGYNVTVVPNQGKGAAKARIEAGRRMFPACWFNESTTDPGLVALGWYHEKRDEIRNVGLGPEHDWSSHAADSYGLMAIVHEQFEKESQRHKPKESEYLPEPMANRW